MTRKTCYKAKVQKTNKLPSRLIFRCALQEKSLDLKEERSQVHAAQVDQDSELEMGDQVQ